MKKTLLIFFIIIWLAFGVYLLLPAPTILDLPNSLKSDEPGDTVQVSDIAAYFNDHSREYVVAYYMQQFSKSGYDSLRLPTYALTHPPEYAQVRVRDQIKAWYFEELVHPFRESLFVVGWTPALKQASLKVKYAPIVVDDRIFYQKTTVRFLYSSLPARISIYMLLTAVLLIGYPLLRRSMKENLWNQSQ